jgi:LysM repeat protein
MPPGASSTLRLAAWTAGLVVVARLLVAAGDGALSVPLTSVDALVVWSTEAPPADMAMALVRLAALVATGYLLVVTALAVVARLLRGARLAAAVDRVSPALVRRVVTGGSGLGLALGAAVGSLPSPHRAPPPAPSTVAAAPAPAPVPAPPTDATMTRTDDHGAAATPAPAPVPAPPAEATMTRTDDHGAVAAPAAPASDALATMTRFDDHSTGGVVEPAPDATATMTRTDDSGPAARRPPALPAVDPATWVVEPGDSLWSIAEDVVGAEVVAGAGAAVPGERAVARYWRRLVAANRPQLVDPANPDLLVPGQRLVVPASDA